MSASAIGLERLARWGGLLLLISTFGAAGALLRSGEAPPAPGFAEEGRRSVGTVERGRVAELHVEAGDLVRAGEPLARLDPALLDREIAALEAAAEAAASRARSRADRVVRAADDARTRLAEARGEAALAQARLGTLRRALGDQQSLVERGLDGGERASELQADLSEAEAEARAAEALVASLSVGGPPASLSAEASARVEADAALREADVLRARRAELELRSPIEGRVAMVWHRPGDAVEPGEPVVDIVPLRAERAVACVDARVARTLQPDQPAIVEDLAGYGSVAARIVAVGPAWQEADPRCRLTLYQPGWVLPVSLALEGGAELAPGAPISVRWLPPSAVPVAQGARMQRPVP